MDKLRNSTNEAFAAFACSISLTVVKRSREEIKRLGFFRSASRNHDELMITEECYAN